MEVLSRTSLLAFRALWPVRRLVACVRVLRSADRGSRV